MLLHFFPHLVIMLRVCCICSCRTESKKLLVFGAQANFFIWAFEIQICVMGRPAGTVETKFTEEEKIRIVGSVDHNHVSTVISTKGLEDIADLFNKAGEKDATITRIQLEENAYILQPLFEASPVHTIHIDSFLWPNGIWRDHAFDWCPMSWTVWKKYVQDGTSPGCCISIRLADVVSRILKRHTANAELCLRALAWDVKAMMQTLVAFFPFVFSRHWSILRGNLLYQFYVWRSTSHFSQDGTEDTEGLEVHGTGPGLWLS